MKKEYILGEGYTLEFMGRNENGYSLKQSLKLNGIEVMRDGQLHNKPVPKYILNKCMESMNDYCNLLNKN